MKKPKKDGPDKAVLKVENEIIKIKMSLEHGATFSDFPAAEHIDPALENMFLNHILEFEKQFRENKRIKVFDRLGQPEQFKPSSQIADSGIAAAWQELYLYMVKHRIELNVCSPNVKPRALYRFATEELFLLEIDDIDINGMVCNFIYDDFYPDHKYDNSRIAMEDCMEYIFRKKSYEWMHHFREYKLRLNNTLLNNKEDFKRRILNFQNCYDNIRVDKLKNFDCIIKENKCFVKGNYTISVSFQAEELLFDGTWLVEFEHNDEIDFWEIINVQISGLNF